jgi:hypothetical protein
MRRPLLLIVVLAVAFVAMMGGFGAFMAPYRGGGWLGIGPNMMGGPGPWGGYGPGMMYGYGSGAKSWMERGLA